jgi:integrase/recombinase XerC
MSDFEKAHKGYIHHLEKERNLSVHTVRAYIGDLDSFFEHLELQKVSSIGDITLAHIRSWLATQQVKGGARTTLSRRATSIRLFTKWATKNGYLAKDVGAGNAKGTPHTP